MTGNFGLNDSGNLGDIVARGAADGGVVDLGTGARFLPEKLDALAGRCAADLGARFAPGDSVAILGRNSAAYVVAYLAVMRAGLVAVPINYRLPMETIGFILDDSAAKLVLADTAMAPLAGDRAPIEDLAAVLQDRPNTPLPPVTTGPDDIAEILYTSGSTGRPKGVPLSHHGQLWALDQFCRISAAPPQRTIIAAPMYHMNGLFFSTVCAAMGYQAVLMPAFDAAEYLKAVAEHRCNLLSGIPTMFALLAREGDLIRSLDLSSVSDVVIGSAPLTMALIDRVRGIFPNAAVRNSYGTTETGPAMFGPHPDGLARPPLSLGYPYPGVEWRLSGGPFGEEGELETRTPATLTAYRNLPEATAAKLENGWYRTGDVVRRDEQGFFYFVGRSDDMFVCGGENIYPGEVEKLLERMDDVLEAAVVGVADEIKGAIPVAFVVPAPGRSIDVSAVKRFALDHGPAYAHPRQVIVLENLPVGTTHKVDKTLLTRRAADIVRESGRA